MSLRLLRWSSVHRNAFSAGRPVFSRSIFSLLGRSKPKASQEPVPILSEDNLFHPFSKSPFPAVRARGEAIQKLSPCPVCASQDDIHVHTKSLPKAVRYECPDCGWPTHCSEDHWKDDTEHQKYCIRLREANMDEHDLRSGRRMREFELPGKNYFQHRLDNLILLKKCNQGPQGFEEAISFANWDVFWYTRGFPSMDTERSRRHASKLLTYPLTIGGAVHQHSGLTLNNQRVTPEGSRSLAGKSSCQL